jgi:aminoglycoside phosphotransferase (APT) family kinase protein
VAARLTLSNGDRAFVKAVGDLNPESPDIHRAEARIAAALPAGTPAPRLLGTLDADGWVVLAYEDIDGRQPAQPWQPRELTRVLDALTDLAATLSPAPIEAPPVISRFSLLGRGWQELAASAASGADDLAGLDTWAAARLEGLATVERDRLAAAIAGTTLAHGDIRADNVLLTSRRVVFVDWPWACLAPVWFDLLAMLPSVAMQGGPAPEQVFTTHQLGRSADPDDVTIVVLALTGLFLYLSRQPEPPGLPTLRAFQRAQGAIALGWLVQRLRLPQGGLRL